MPDQKINPNEINDREISRLRDTVLKWVDAKKEVETLKPKIKKAISKIKPKIVLAPKPKTGEPKVPLAPAGLKKTNPANRKKIAKITTLALILSLLSTLIIFSLGVYYFKWRNPAVKFITRIIPYPAAVINFKPLSYYQWQEELDDLMNFYQKVKIDGPNGAIPSLKETQNQVLERMIEKELINQLAEKYGIALTTEEIEENTRTLAEEIGSREALAGQLEKLYGWTIADFQAGIIKPLLLKSKLKMAITSDDRLNQEAEAKAKEALIKIKNGQNSFEELARLYSEDVTAVKGGDLGYFGRGQMVPEFEQAAFDLKIGEISDIVKTQFGFHIIKLEEKLFDEQGKISQIRVKHILIKGKDLDEYLEELKKEMVIWRLVK